MPLLTCQWHQGWTDTMASQYGWAPEAGWAGVGASRAAHPQLSCGELVKQWTPGAALQAGDLGAMAAGSGRHQWRVATGSGHTAAEAASAAQPRPGRSAMAPASGWWLVALPTPVATTATTADGFAPLRQAKPPPSSVLHPHGNAW